MSSSSSTDQWDRVARLFEAARGLPPDERDRFLDEECDNAPDVRAEVVALLDADDEAGDFFDDLESSVFQGREREPADFDPYFSESDPTIGRYRLLGRIGSGGMGVVYKARDPRLDRVVALKVMPPSDETDNESRARFLREARSAAALQHPNICPIFDAGETRRGGLYIAMAMQTGPTLRESINAGLLKPKHIHSIALQTARALESAHKSGIVHRDLKPGNLIVNGITTKEPHVQVIDFGLAKPANLSMTRTGTVLGTVGYMSPEQTRGEAVGPASDVWSFGVVLYELLAGEMPFQGEHAAAIIHAINNPAPKPLPPSAPDDLAAVVRRCLQAKPSDRFPDGRALRQAVDRATPDLPLPESAPEASTPAPSRMWLASGLVLLFALAAAVGLAYDPAPPLPDTRHVVVAPEPGDEADGALPVNAVESGIAETLTSRLRSTLLAQRAEGDGDSEASPLLVVPETDVDPTVPMTADRSRSRHSATLLLHVSSSVADGLRTTILRLRDTQSSEVLREDVLTSDEAALTQHTDSLAVLAASLLGTEPSGLPRAPARRVERAGPYCVEARGRLRHHEQDGNVESAIALFRRAVETDSAAACGHAGLGESYWRKYTASRNPAWIDSAVAAGEQALIAEGEDAHAHVTLGLIDTERGEFGSAIFHFEYALEQDPTLVRARRGLARALESADRPERAERVYLDAIDRDPAYWGAYNDLGKFYLRRGRYEDAVQRFQEVVERAPRNVIGYRNLGVSHYFRGDLDAAIRAYRTANDISPSYATYTNVGTFLASRGDYAEAAEAFRNALDINDQDHRVWGSYAEALAQAGQPSTAADAYASAVERANAQLEMDPGNEATLVYLANYHVARDDTAAARTVVRSLTRTPLDNPSNVFSIGQILASLGDTEQAFTYFDRAVNRGYRIGPARRYPRIQHLWDQPRFASLVERSRSQ